MNKFGLDDIVIFDTEKYIVIDIEPSGEMYTIRNLLNSKVIITREDNLTINYFKFSNGGIVQGGKPTGVFQYAGGGETKEMIDRHVEISQDYGKYTREFKIPKCECGAASLGYTTHMDYCPKVVS